MVDLANVMTVGVGILIAFTGNSFFFDVHNSYTQEIFLSGNEFEPNIIELKNSKILMY